MQFRFRVLLSVVFISAVSVRAADDPPATTRPAGAASGVRITFIGSDTAVPAAGEDTSCFTIDDTLLVDCGWNAAINMRQYGLDPLKIQTLYITHFHHDHYLGLAALLFYRGMNRTQLVGKPPLVIVGPAEDIQNVVDLAKKYLQAGRFPNVWPAIELRPLEPGSAFETDRYKIETVRALHPVQGFCSRYTDKASGVAIAFSGDTNPNAEFAKLAAGADLLIHEASIGPKAADDKIGKDHSRSIDGARIAKQAGVKKLVITHVSASQREASLAAAKEIFPKSVLAAAGEKLLVAKGGDGGEVAVDSKLSIITKEFIYEDAPFPQCHASTIAQTADGLAAAWFGGTGESATDVGIWCSRHDGKRWSAPVEAANGVMDDGKRYACWNPVLFQMPDKRLVLFYKVGPSPSRWWGMRIVSEDAGKTWSKPVRLGDGILGPIKNKPILLADGSLLCGSSTEHAGWRVHMEITKDLGGTCERLVPPAERLSVIQPTILDWGGRKIQILCRTGQGRIAAAWSEDGGESWGKLELTDLPNPNSGIDAVMLKNRVAVLIYNKTRSGRSPLNVAYSTDGKTWKDGPVLESERGEYSYPAVIQSSDGEIHVTYTWQRKRVRHVVLDWHE